VIFGRLVGRSASRAGGLERWEGAEWQFGRQLRAAAVSGAAEGAATRAANRCTWGPIHWPHRSEEVAREAGERRTGSEPFGASAQTGEFSHSARRH